MSIAAASPTGAVSPLGRPSSRVDGVLKTTGQARYAAEHFPPGLVHAVAVQSTVAAGRVAAVDAADAEAVPGVIAVFWHANAPRLGAAKMFPMGPAASSFLPLQDDRVRWSGQHVAVVVAETLDAATEAARRLRIRYEETPALSGIDDPAAQTVPAKSLSPMAPDESWGQPDAALALAPVRLTAEFTTPRHYNNPIEPHATVAQWHEDGRLTVWEPSQWVEGARQLFADWFELELEQVRVISPFVGGGFGCKACPQPHAALAVMAAKAVGRPVKLALGRPQMFTGHGGRPATVQRLQLGAERDGRLVSIVQECVNETSVDDPFVEPGGSATALYYAVPNLRTSYSLVRANVVTPGWMRAPGEAVSTFALESLMDELAYEVGADPIELRLRNWADADPADGKPWSTRRLREALAEGARAFGWDRRNPAPRSMRSGHMLVGQGMACGSYPVLKTASEARVRITAEGAIEVESGGADIGTGFATIAAQAAADALGVDGGEVTVRTGDTVLARAPLAGGSQLSNDVLPVIHAAAAKARDELLRLGAAALGSNAVEIAESRVRVAGDPARSMSFADVLRASRRASIDILHDNLPANANSEADRRATFNGVMRMKRQPTDTHATHSWSAVFAEVHVDEDFGTIRVKRIVAAVDCGLLYNPKLAESQIQGGIVMGLGMALLEAADVDPHHARIVNANLAEYMLPVNADVPDIEVISVGEPDFHANSLGGKSVGELGITGVAAAIANAVFHATGRRVRDLPITLEKLL